MMLLAYDVGWGIVATLDQVGFLDSSGNAIGLVDFEAHEAAGGALTDIWQVSGAAGSGTWPEWLGARAHDFRAVLGPDKRIAALVHKMSGYRRERAAIEAAIAAVIPDQSGIRDIRHIVGGPTRPLHLDDQGRTSAFVPSGTPAHLPLVGRPTAD